MLFAFERSQPRVVESSSAEKLSLICENSRLHHLIDLSFQYLTLVLSPNQERDSVLFVTTGQRSKPEPDVSPAWSRQSRAANAASWSSEIGCGEDPTGISLLNDLCSSTIPCRILSIWVFSADVQVHRGYSASIAVLG